MVGQAPTSVERAIRRRLFNTKDETVLDEAEVHSLTSYVDTFWPGNLRDWLIILEIFNC
jgi:hypothetical protein